MKMTRILLILAVLFITQTGLSEEFNGKVLMRVNGHKYLMDDLLGRTLINEWNKNRGSFYDGITLGKIKKLKYKTVPGSPDKVKLYLTIERTKFCKYKVCGYVDFEEVIITLNKVMTNKGWCLVTEEAVQVGDVDVFFNNSGLWIINGFLDLIMNAIFDIFLELPAWIVEQVQGYTVRFNAEQETIVLIPLKTFTESGHSIVVQDTITEIQDLINSFPIDITFDYESNTVINNPQTGAHTNYDGLIIDIELMPGYGNNLTQYMSGNPTLPANPVLTRGGFAMKGDNYPAIDVNSSMSWEEEIEAVHSIIKNELGLSDVRIEATWKWIVGTIPEIEYENIPGFPNITNDDVDEYIQQIEGLDNNDDIHLGWDWLDRVINDAVSQGLRPLVIVGEALQGDTPLFLTDYGELEHIVPGTPRGVYADTSIGVSESVYKYWLELYSRAVVRRYQDRVDFWEADCELNASRYTESFDWWRVGSAWHDDAVGGFQDQIAELLYNAIHSEDKMISQVGDSDVQVVQAFHVFDMARRLDQWQNYYDIAGIQFYPNEMFGYPVLGYMIGETVYSVKRALDVLGLEKPVWVLENMYPVDNEQFLDGFEEANPDTMQDYSQNINYRSTKRQKQFVKEAIQTSAKYGADVYNYFRLITSFYHNPYQGAGATYSSVNMYGGLIRRDGVNQTLTQLPAFDTYHDEFDANSPLDWVTLKTMYLDTEDLEGTLSVDDAVSGIASGESTRLNETRQYTARVDNEWLNKPSNGDAVKHHKWNNDNTESKLKHNFTPNTDELKIQTARYKDQEIIYFSVDVPGAPDEEYTYLIKIRDPWYVTSSKTQLNEFIALGDTNVYSVFLDQQPDQGEVYHVKAPNLFATVDGIYEFSGWGGTNVSFANSGNRETNVVFEAAGATATASYTLVSNQEYGVIIPTGDELIIPAGADFTCANDFTLQVEGELIIAGTNNEPVSLVTNDFAFSPPSTAFIEVSDGGKLYGSGLQITGEPENYTSPPLIKAQPGSIVKISHSTFNTNGTGIMVEDAYVELSRCVVSLTGIQTDNTNGINITLNEFSHNSYSETNNLYNQVILENCTIRGMDKGIDIDFTINGPGFWKGLYTHNSILTENNTGLLGIGYLTGNVEFEYVNISNSTNYEIPQSQSIITNHIQTSGPQLDVNHYPTASSPVIDWGDPSSPLDPDGTIIDLGAYYKHQPPSKPTNFKIRGLAGNSPRLTFNSNEVYVHTWHILRKLGNQQEFSLLAVVSETQYIDNTVTIAANKKFSQDACYKVIAVDDFGYESNPTSSICKAVEGNQDKHLTVPFEYALHHAFPNPFNPETTIKYDLPEQSQIQLSIFDLLGRKINTLKSQTEDGGYYSIKWVGKDENGHPLSSGMYIIQMTAKSMEDGELFTKAQKVVLLK